MKFKIPVFYTMYGHYEMEADSLEEAMELIYADVTPLPEDSEYVMDSLQVDEESLFDNSDILKMKYPKLNS